MRSLRGASCCRRGVIAACVSPWPAPALAYRRPSSPAGARAAWSRWCRAWQHHITDAYGDYWTAYDLDFLSGGSPAVSPSPYDVVRSSGLAAQVASAKSPAWLFFAPDQVSRAAAVFANPQPGPGPYTEQTFEDHLKALGIGYTVVKLGVLDAVVPARPPPGL
jgi:hypothetical protein